MEVGKEEDAVETNNRTWWSGLVQSSHDAKPRAYNSLPEPSGVEIQTVVQLMGHYCDVPVHGPVATFRPWTASHSQALWPKELPVKCRQVLHLLQESLKPEELVATASQPNGGDRWTRAAFVESAYLWLHARRPQSYDQDSADYRKRMWSTWSALKAMEVLANRSASTSVKCLDDSIREVLRKALDRKTMPQPRPHAAESGVLPNQWSDEECAAVKVLFKEPMQQAQLDMVYFTRLLREILGFETSVLASDGKRAGKEENAIYHPALKAAITIAERLVASNTKTVGQSALERIGQAPTVAQVECSPALGLNDYLPGCLRAEGNYLMPTLPMLRRLETTLGKEITEHLVSLHELTTLSAAAFLTPTLVTSYGLKENAFRLLDSKLRTGHTSLSGDWLRLMRSYYKEMLCGRQQQRLASLEA